MEYFEDTVCRCPDRTAVIEGERSVSFRELRAAAMRLGAVLLERTGGEHKKVIAVFLEKGIDSVVADLAILCSGNAYMNLDVKNPAKRIENILARIDPAVLITDEKHADELTAMAKGRPVVLVKTEGEAETRGDAERELLSMQERVIDTDLLCVINTSGSTGTPKGVALNHRGFIDFTEWSVREGLVRDGEVIGCLSPSVFDIYSFELCMLMAKGCTMVMIPERLAAFPIRILQLLERWEVTFIFWVPTIMVNIANMNLLAEVSLPRLRTVWFAGEVFPTQKFNYWRRMLPEAVFVNLYGPIEITLDCTAYKIEREIEDSEPIPIGYPCRNTDILILKEDDSPAAPGEEGELCVRGSSLAMGYYNDPTKTVEAFVQNPLNRSYPELIYRTGDIVFVNPRGEMVFKGRKDTLIKHMGYRIELAEIEHTVVDTLRMAANCCAVYDAAKKEIVLFYETPSPLVTADMRKQIGGVLPRYMIPAVYRHMPELPRNANGKIDRFLLKETLSDK
jgi:amino acid adenylation domain-containing protein